MSCPISNLARDFVLGGGSENARIPTRILSSIQGENSVKKKSILESLPVLLLLGVLAGAVGGLGIGLIQLRAASSAAAAAGK
jgi:hypothetical protein